MKCPYDSEQTIELQPDPSGRLTCPACGRVYVASSDIVPIVREIGRSPKNLDTPGSRIDVNVWLIIRFRGGGRSARRFTAWDVARRERERLCARIMEEDEGDPIVDFHFCLGEPLLFSVMEIGSVEVSNEPTVLHALQGCPDREPPGMAEARRRGLALA